MKDRAQLIALWTIALLASIVLIQKGRGLPPTCGASPAFSFPHSNGVRVKVTGIEGISGIYCMPEGTALRSVINMAPQRFVMIPAMTPDPARLLKDGEWVEFAVSESEPARISLKMIAVEERMLLGIPLDPSIMTESDWERLPGIGPSLARRIVNDRQSNGGYGSLRDLERIPGIGKVTVDRLEPYF